MSTISWPSAQGPRDSRIRNTDWSVRPTGEEVRPVFPQEEVPPIQAPEPQFSLPPEPPQSPEPSVSPQPAVAPEAPLTSEVDHQFALLAGALSEVVEARGREEKKRAEEVFELGLAVAEELAAGAIEIEPQRVLVLIAEATELLGETRNLRVRFHPALFEHLDSAGLLEDLRSSGQIDIRPDGAVDDIGCIVESNAGRVDARVRARLGRLRHTLKQELGSEP
ncbi:MAG: hypothetical protein GY847_05965 [Proteobacteria bacterium]|nr:hypothetical protein [Pseudomonadota bacterium]